MLKVMTAQSGIGTGLIILLTVWIVALIIAVISLRTEKIIGVISIASALTITTVLLALPVESDTHTQALQHKDHDYTSLWRCLLAIFLTLCSFGSVAVFFTHHCAEPVNAVPVNTWIVY